MLGVISVLGVALILNNATTTQTDAAVTAAQPSQVSPVVVKTVSFIGSAGIPQSERDKFARELEGKTYRSDSDLTQKVVNFWREFGFWKVHVKAEPAAAPENGGKGINPVFEIDEGNQYRVKELRSSAIAEVAPDLQAMFQMKPGDVADATKIRRGVELLRAAYVDRGYSHAEVISAMQFDDSEHTVALIFDVTAGTEDARSVHSAECKSVLALPTKGPQLTSPFLPVLSYDPGRDAVRDVQNAIQEAQRTQKNVLIVVGGDWCVSCHILDRIFQEHPQVAQVRDANFVTVLVNHSEENKNKEFLSRMPEMSGVPHLFVLDQYGRLLVSETAGELEESRGYSDKRVEDFLRKWSPGNSPLKCNEGSSESKSSGS